MLVVATGEGGQFGDPKMWGLKLHSLSLCVSYLIAAPVLYLTDLRTFNTFVKISFVGYMHRVVNFCPNLVGFYRSSPLPALSFPFPIPALPPFPSVPFPHKISILRFPYRPRQKPAEGLGSAVLSTRFSAAAGTRVKTYDKNSH